MEYYCFKIPSLSPLSCVIIIALASLVLLPPSHAQEDLFSDLILPSMGHDSLSQDSSLSSPQYPATAANDPFPQGTSASAGGGGQDSIQRDFLKPQNDARVALGLAPLTWDETLASYARKYSNTHVGDCELVHSNGPYGENLVMGAGEVSIAEAVKLWIDEGASYVHSSNSCVGDKMCGHYTQVVWRDTARVGCAKVKCNNGGTFISCNYDPPGNIVGQSPY